MKQFRRLLDISAKDLLVIGKDRGSWIVLLLTPLAVIMVASFALGPAFKGQLKSQLLAANLDQGQIGGQLIDSLKATEGLEVIQGSAQECADLAAGDQKFKTSMVIPADFSSRILSGAGTGLHVYVDPSDNVNRPFMVGMIDGAASRLSGMVTAVRVSVTEVQKFSPGSDPAQVAGDAAPAAVQQMAANPPVAVEISNAGGMQDINMFDTQAPGYSVMFLLFGVMLGAEGLLEERDKGTLGRLLVAPVSEAAILGGKLVAQFFVAAVQMIILFGVGHFVFGMHLGNSIAGLVMMIAITAFTATAFGILLASVVKTRRQATSVGTLVIILMSALGGSWWPLSIEPQFMQTLGHLTINAWALDGLNALILNGKGLVDILPQASVLFGYGVVCFLIGIKTFKFRTA
ncbi:MAG: ABC transporter permease [Actinobacteria bacterium]|nr:ABC transporter permease [Actinomycetota bacterium]